MNESDYTELEELEEELQEEPENQENITLLTEENTCLTIWKQSYRDSVFPFAFLDNKLRILWTNAVFRTIIGRGAGLEGRYFTSLFSETGSDMESFFQAVFGEKYGYSWKGRLETREKEHLNLILNVMIFPVRETEIPSSDAPNGYGAVIDDITEENKNLVRGTFKSLLEASKLKDNDTGQHIQRVNEYSGAMAEALYGVPDYSEIDREFMDNIAFLAAMHDVGKIGTPDDILNKQGPLNEQEWKIMKEHTINGAYILSTYPNPMAKEIALFHHEKWNSSGYPYNLEGKLIPLSARIVAIADVYDALRMKRSYKEPFTHEKAVELINEQKGEHFDPRLIDLFNSMNRDYNTIFNKLSDR